MNVNIPNPSEPHMLQWLMFITLITAVKVRAPHDCNFLPLVLLSILIFFTPKFKFEFQKGYLFETKSYKTLVSITSYFCCQNV